MTARHWGRLRDLFHDALPLDDCERSVLLARVRTESPELHSELAALLAEEAAPDGALGRGARVAVESVAPQRLGAYELGPELGRGGMGVVFQAVRREGDFQQTAAIKILTRWLLDAGEQRRFLLERQALAQLDHPNIARLLDWGATPDGHPYLVMEHVAGGVAIDEFCARSRARAPRVIELFAQLCDAVSHAHRSLVVHRDLKPGNVLVTAVGQVKLLDFGIAKLLDAGEARTATAEMLLTPGYASPEQIQGQAVTVAADIYSLGVLLYRLLAGCSPFRNPENLCAALEEDPLPPSRRAALPWIPAREIAGDLDAIVLKALRGEPGSRYQSVEQLAADLERHRRGLPVLARQGSRSYVIGRFVRRNRTNVALAALAICSLLGGTAVALWKWRAAETDYRELRSFAWTMNEELGRRNARPDLETQQRLAGAALSQLARLSRERPDDDLQLELAGAYLRLADLQGEANSPNTGNAAPALANYRHAYAILMAQWRLHPDKRRGSMLIDCVRSWGAAIPDPASSAALLDKALAIARQLAAGAPRDAAARAEFAVILFTRGQRRRQSGDLQAALESQNEALAAAEEALARDPESHSGLTIREGALAEIAAIQLAEGRLEEALASIRQARQVATQVMAGAGSTQARREVAFKQMVEGEILGKLRRFEPGLEAAGAALNELRAIASSDASNQQAKMDLAMGWFRLGDVQLAAGRFEEALASHRIALALRREQAAKRGASDLQVGRLYISSLNRVARLLIRERDRTGAAARDLDESIGLGRRIVAQAPSDVQAIAGLARAFRERAALAGQREDAMQLLRESLGLWRDARRRDPLEASLPSEMQQTEDAMARLAAQ